MATITDQQAAAWAVTRAIGRNNYIWLYGVLLYGLATPVVGTFLLSLIKGESFFDTPPYVLLMFGPAGYLWARWMWDWSEKAYQQYLAERERR